jgi:hypothetical protein
VEQPAQGRRQIQRESDEIPPAGSGRLARTQLFPRCCPQNEKPPKPVWLLSSTPRLLASQQKEYHRQTSLNSAAANARPGVGIVHRHFSYGGCCLCLWAMWHWTHTFCGSIK